MEAKPNTECPIIEIHVDGVISSIMVDHVKASDLPAERQLGRIVGFLAIANKYLTEQGAFVIEGRTIDTKLVMGGWKSVRWC